MACMKILWLVLLKEGQYVLKNKSLFAQLWFLLAFSILFPLTFAWAAVGEGKVSLEDILIFIELGKYVPAMMGVLMAAMLAAEAFAGERERKTLETLVATPLQPKDLILGKLAYVIGLALCLEIPAGVSFILAAKFLIAKTDFSVVDFPNRVYVLTVTLFSVALILLVGCWVTFVSAYVASRAAAATSSMALLVPLSMLIAAVSLFKWEISETTVLGVSFIFVLIGMAFALVLMLASNKEILLLGLAARKVKKNGLD